MKGIAKKRSFTLITTLFVSLNVLFLFSCKKTVDTNTENPNITPDFVTKVTSSVSGFVSNENNMPVSGATVKVGTVTVTTDQYGYFNISNVEVVKDAATVTVTNTGYFKGIKTYAAKEGKAAFFRIKLLPKTIIGSIDATTGGTASQSNGLMITLPANAVKNAATGAVYTGTVSVAAQFIDPTSTEIVKTMPGDLRAINSDGYMKLLTSYGMMAVELTGASGELLQIADGKKATITSTIPASILSTAPSTIPLWHFDEEKGLWIEEGVATKTGNNYVGEVSHFSFWNYDIANNYVHFECTVFILNSAARQPLPNAYVKISVASPPGMSSFGITDSSGYVAGFIPDHQQLQLRVLQDYQCTGGALYFQNFTTTNTDVSLGDIEINSTNGIQLVANIAGTVTDCNNHPLATGNVVLSTATDYYITPLNSNGAYNYNLPMCDNVPVSVIIRANNLAGGIQSYNTTALIHPGANVIPNIQACGGTNFASLSTGYFYHPAISRIINENKDITLVSANIFEMGVADLGGSGYTVNLALDPVTNHVNITAALGAAGAPYTQFDSGLPTSNPVYTPAWPNSAECNNTYDPATHTFKLRYGYSNATSGWRVIEEIVQML